ncbi:NACHT domain-containing protein [Paenibacillus sp. BAC0078]
MSMEQVQFGVELFERNIERIVKGVFKLSKDKEDTRNLESGIAFKNYLNNAYAKYSKIKTILYNRESVFLKDFYVSQSLSFNKQRIETESVKKILRLGNYILITGTGGIGKTTFMKNAFLNTILETDLIPLYIELKDMNGRELNLIDTIYNSLKNLGFNLSQEYFNKSLLLGKFVFFLDGFDEIENSKRDSVRRELIDLTDNYQANKYIVSSRKSNEFNEWVMFKEMDITPLTLSQAKTMITKLEYDETTKQEFIKALEDSLFKTHSSFASIPLLLTIMFLTFNQHADIPEKKHEFYEAAFDVLYSKHDATKGLKRDRFTTLSITEFKRILNYISLFSYLEDEISFNNTKILQYISNAKEIEEKKFNEDDYKEDLLKSVCILIEEGFSYKFSHRSFQEYFAAKCIEGLNDEGKKEVLRKLFEEKPYSIEQDIVFKTLFDINRSILEYGLFNEILDDFFGQINASDEEGKLYLFLSTLYSSINLECNLIGLEGINNENDAITYTYKNETYRINMIFKFLLYNYSNIVEYPPKPNFDEMSDDVSIMKLYYEDDEEANMGNFKIGFNKVKEIPELYRFVIRQSKYRLWEMQCLELIHSKIKESSDKNKYLSSLFKRRN